MKQSADPLSGNAPQTTVMSGSSRDLAATTPPVQVSGPDYYITPDGKLVFTFNEPIKLGSGTFALHGNQQYLNLELGAASGLSVEGNTLTFDPPAGLAENTEYTIYFAGGSIFDLSGNSLGGVNEASVLSARFKISIETAPVDATGTASNDTIHGSNFADTISGGIDGRDELSGHGGDDVINGGDEPPDRSGNILYMWGDTISGGAGNDTLHGNGGQDSLSGGSGDDKLYGDADEDFLFGGAGNDLLDGGERYDELRDDDGNNILLGGAGDDRLFTGAGTSGRQEGGEGNDQLNGYGGVDYFGGNGNDQITLTLSGLDTTVSTIDGGAGDDRIVLAFDRPGRPSVAIRGGEGVDTYAVGGTMAADSWALATVNDFTAGVGGDRIDLLALLGSDYVGNPFKDGLVRLVDNGAVTLLELRVADAPNGYVPLLVLAGVSASSLTRDNFVDGIDPTGLAEGVVLEGKPWADVLTGTPHADTLRGNGDDDRLTGNGGNDTLEGGAGNDVLDGGNGDDTLAGGTDDDVLHGGFGSNTFDGGAGNDALNGSIGIDHAVFTGKRSDYTIMHTVPGAVFTVTDKRGAAGDGQDTLALIERLVFADGHLAFDTAGAAGDVYRLYRAVFDRAPDLAGQGFWMEMLERGVSLQTIATTFVASDEFTGMVGAAPSNAQIVTRLYQNILHREPEPGGYAFWLDILDTGKADLATVLIAFSNGAENTANVAELIANGIAYTPFG